MFKHIYDNGNMMTLAPDLIKQNILLTVIEKLIDKHIIQNIKKLVFLDRIDEMDERELDLLAEELHLEEYDFSMTLSEKIKICKNSFFIHTKKGTVNGIEEILKKFFLSSEIIEWYNDELLLSGYFKIKIYDDEVDYNNIKKIRNLIDETKKYSQHLQNITFTKTDRCNIKVRTGTYSSGYMISNFNKMEE